VIATRALAAALALLLSAGCAGRRVPQLPVPERIDQVRDNYARVDDVVGLINVVVAEGGEQERLGGSVVFQRPDRLRLEVLTPLGQAVATIVHREGRVVVHDHREDAWWVGRVGGERALRVYGVPLEVAAWIETLRDGGLPAAGPFEPGAPHELRVRRGGRELILELDEDRPVLRRRRSLLHASLVEETRYDDFARLSGVHHPGKVRISWPERRRSIEIRFRKKAINRGVDATHFRLEPPAGARVGRLEEGVDG